MVKHRIYSRIFCVGAPVLRLYNNDRLGTFILHVPSTAKMIFISAAAVIFLVTKFKEVDWAKTCVVLPDEEEDHERYFLSDQPHSKIGEEPTPQMVRSVSDEFV